MMKYILQKISKNTSCVAKHVYINKHWYALGTFGMFAVVKMVILFTGFFGLTNVHTTFAAQNELNTTNITTTYGCDVKANQCDLSKKGITSIAANTFINHPNLAVLLLNDNQISSIEENAFNGPIRLEVLHLHGNLLTNLPSTVANIIKNAKEIRLNGNCWNTAVMSKELVEILDKMTGGNWQSETNKSCPLVYTNELNSSNVTTTYGCDTKATQCDLSKRGITSIAANTFINHPSLETLLLNGNRISVVADDAFNGAINLKVLHLEDNLLSNLSTTVANMVKNTKEANFDRNCWNASVMSKELVEIFDKVSGGSWRKEVNSMCPFSCANVTDVPQTECEALVSLYNSTNGLGWTNKNGRGSSFQISNWNGVTIYEGHVVEINLQGNNLSGTIPTEINKLSYLKQLDLSSNNILSIASDAFVGLTNIININLSNNKITAIAKGSFDTIPSRFGLNISDNFLTEFPMSYDKLISMGQIGIYRNCWNIAKMELNIIKTFNKSFGDGWQKESNNACPFSCTNVTDVSQSECESLVSLYNSTNGKEWTNSQGRLSSLQVTNWYGVTVNEGRVMGINLQGNNLSGTIPSEINKLSYLKQLNLSLNQISSVVNEAFIGLNNLRNLNISNNKITIIPEGFLNLHYLAILNISNNLLTNFSATTEDYIRMLLEMVKNLEGLSVNINCWNIPSIDKRVIEAINNKVGGSSWQKELSKSCPFLCANVTDVPQSECEALVSLYTATNGKEWINKNGRLSSPQVANWYGIGTQEMGEDKKQHVVSINLEDNNLSGTVPFSGLTYLQKVALANNKITALTMDGFEGLNIREINVVGNLLTAFPTTTPEALKKRFKMMDHTDNLGTDRNCWNVPVMEKELVEIVNKKSGGDRWQKEFNDLCPLSCQGSPVQYSCSDISPDSLASPEKYCPLFYSTKDNAQCTFDRENKKCAAAKLCEPKNNGLYISYDTNTSAKVTIATVNFPNKDCVVVNGDDVYKFSKNGTYFFEVKCPVIDSEKTIRLLANVSWLKDISSILVPNASRLKSSDLIYKADGKQVSATAQFANGKETRDYTDADRKKAAYANSIETVNVLPGKSEDMIEKDEKVYLKNTNLDMAASSKITKETILTDNKVSIIIPALTTIVAKEATDDSMKDGTREYSGTFIAPVKIEDNNEISDNLTKKLGGSAAVKNIYKFGSDNNETLYAKKDSSVEENDSFTITMETTQAVGKTYNIYYSQDGIAWEFFTGATVIANNESGNMVSFAVDHLTYYALTEGTGNGTNTTTATTSNGGGGSIIIKDECPVQRDCSDSYYDAVCGSCSLVEKIVQKLPFHYDNVQTGSTVNSPFPAEINSAYLWAYGYNITTIPTIQNANIGGTLIRKDMAKMISNFALNVLDKDVSTGKNCTFSDMASLNKETQYYAMVACRLGLMGYETDGITLKKNFDPEMEVDRGQFGTILSRLLRKGKHNGGIVFYKKHLEALKKEGIMTKIETPSAKEKRGRVMIMMQRVFESK